MPDDAQPQLRPTTISAEPPGGNGLSGAIGGFAATVPMTAAMVTMHAVLPAREQYPLPPNPITHGILPRMGIPERMVAAFDPLPTLAAHFGFGGFAGAGYPAWRRSWPRAGRAQAGISYGLLVWALSYLGWVPAARLLPPASRHPRRRVLLMLAAHVVWGYVTALAAERGGRRHG
ncbi:DUF1440 domain-containing protein [Indioceanicola profundi]|uniref:DUF1440 domain-containing protein n=1 Tax=Indioceanicola profundi TaxID=2220096 RepID=UPI000E6AC5DB|nr:DUF1440 domain-containing protein [Indioceanicola profundi]